MLSTFTVTSTADSASAGTLRWAVQQANLAASASTIDFDPTVFSSTQTINLTLGTLALADTTGLQTITGPSSGLTINGDNASLVFQVDANVDASITGLTFTGGAGRYGGGLQNDGTLALTDCTVSGNSSNLLGGGVYNNKNATATLTDCTISGNSAASEGGGIRNYGTMTLNDSTVSGNSAGNQGGGIADHGAITLIDSTVSGNSAAQKGGGIFVQNAVATSIGLTDSTVSGNSSGYGGGLYNLEVNNITLTNSTFTGNTVSSEGGGLFEDFGSATVTDCTFSGNAAKFEGGGLANHSGVVMMTGCTFSGNTVTFDGGGWFNLSGTMTLTNSTVSGNSAGRYGGGLQGQGTTTLTDSTISGNSSGDKGGGVLNFSGTLTIGDTILAGNTATTSGPDAYGTFTSDGYNLIGKTDGSTGWVGTDLTGTVASPLNPLLAPLGAYGGATETIPLFLGSPAINAGIAVGGVTTDQRGVARPATGPDIGAFQGIDVPVTTTSQTGAGSLGQAIIDTNAAVGSSVIPFDIGAVGSQQTIALSANLPNITNSVLVAGWSQGGAGYDGAPLIQIEGNGGVGLDGLAILADGTTIDGLDIGGFSEGDGIYLRGSGDVIEGTYIGVDAAGAAEVSLQNQAGIDIEGGNDNTIGGTIAADRDILSNNVYEGITLGGNDNVVEGDYIGIDGTGSLAAPNEYGVVVADGESGNTIGGLTTTPGTGAGNVISGNGYNGVWIANFVSNNSPGTGTNDNVVEGNLIGTDASGGALLGNGGDAVYIYDGSAGNTIGGTTASARNVIDAGSTFVAGVNIDGDSSAGAADNVVEGDYIGTDITGTVALSDGIGVLIQRGATDNTIGGLTTSPGTGPADVISGNTSYGVEIEAAVYPGSPGPATSGNVVEGDYIGTNASDDAPLANEMGVVILNGAANNTIGGLTAQPGYGAGDVIWGNSDYNVIISADHPSYVGANMDDVVEGDVIGATSPAPPPGTSCRDTTCCSTTRRATRSAARYPGRAISSRAHGRTLAFNLAAATSCRGTRSGGRPRPRTARAPGSRSTARPRAAATPPRSPRGGR